MIPFFAIDAERWPRMLARLRTLGPLEEDDARADLRYLENEHRVWLLTKGARGAAFLGRPALSKRWGWPDRAVRDLLAQDDWQDPTRPVPVQDLRAKFKGTRKGDAAPCPMDCQSAANVPPMTEPANADNPPIPSNQCPIDVQSMSIARASSGTTINHPTTLRDPPADAAGHAPAPGLFVTAPTEPRRKSKAPRWGYTEAIAGWDAVWAEEMGGTVYPWCWEGQHHDGKRVKGWLSTAAIRGEDDVIDGIGRLRGAIRAYVRAANAGAAFPRGDPPTTRHFTDQLSKWLQTDPAEPPTITPAKSDPNKAFRDLLNNASRQLQGAV